MIRVALYHDECPRAFREVKDWSGTRMRMTSEFKDWLIEHFGPIAIETYEGQLEGYRYVVCSWQSLPFVILRFRNKEDAMLTKLTWSGV